MFPKLIDATLHVTWIKRLPPWLYKIGAQIYLDRDYPRHLFIETTAACNLACGYCPREKRQDAMDFRLFTQVVDEAAHYGPRSFSLHLFGEPLLYVHWLAAVRYLKHAHSSNRVLLTTNGTALNARVDEVVSSQVDLVLWTWRPEAKFTPETKAKLRKWGKFRVRFIEEVTTKEAYAEWADWPNVEGRPLHNYGGQIDVASFRSRDVEGYSQGVRLQTTVHSSHLRWPCYHLFLAPAVAWNGDLLICCADPHHKEVLGHFPDMSVHEAWMGEKLKMIRESHLKGEYDGICKGCDVWKQYPDLFFKWQKG